MEKEIGKVSTYFSHVNVAAIKLSGILEIGNKIHIKGNTTDFETVVKSMQVNNQEMKKANAGNHVGIKVPDKVRPNDIVFKIE
jgi:putative protease